MTHIVLITTGAELAAMMSVKPFIYVTLLGALIITLLNYCMNHQYAPDTLFLREPPYVYAHPLPPTSDPILYEMGRSHFLNGSNTFSAHHHSGFPNAENISFETGLPVDRSRYRRGNTIFYNRVPKCGSTTTFTIMQKLSRRNHFNCRLVPELPLNYFYENKKNEENRFVYEFKRMKQNKVLFHGHLYFKDISEYAKMQNRSSPMYINLVREPLDRLQSFYYFIRYQQGHVRKMGAEKLRMSYTECVRRLDPECTHSDNYMTQIAFFCGAMPFCRLPEMGALQQAKRNVVQHYAVVGTMARLRDFFYALEWTFPSWFKGATRLYDSEVKKNISVHNKLVKIPYSRTLDPDVRFIMTTLLKEDYDFYYFIQQRFAAYMKSIKSVKHKP